MSIKDKIKQRRAELGLTMSDVAKAVGVSESTISRWESGDISNMRQDRIMALCQTLRSSPSELFGWPTVTAITHSGRNSSVPSFGNDDIIVYVSPEAAPAKLPHELVKKIAKLDEGDRSKIEAYADGLLSADKYQTPKHTIKIAARGGGIKDITVTDSQLKALLNSPEVTDLGDADN